MSQTGMGVFSATSDYNRKEELKAFDDTNAGVKGLVDAGMMCIPKIFIRPPEEVAEELKSTPINTKVPVIDLSETQECNRHKQIVEEVRLASEKWGFFQVVNHGIPSIVLDNMIDGIRLFNEKELEVKKKFHSRDFAKPVRFNSNYDLYKSQFANWRDTLSMAASDDHLDPAQLPATCSKATLEYIKHIKKLGDTLLKLLSEALGLKADHLRSMGCAEWCTLACHYYPACPEPALTLGASKHSDAGILTLLLQNHICSLQVLHEGQWVDIHPIPGALVVNIGDLLQIISNGQLLSVKHRVLANHVGPRISVACFFSVSTSEPSKTYGPIKELTSKDNPPRYKEVVISEYMFRFYSSPLDKKPNPDFYKL